MHDRFNDEIDRVLVLKLHRRLGQLRAVQARAAMHMLRGYQVADQRMHGTGENLGLRLSRQLANLHRVLLGEVQRHVAGHGCQSQHVELRAGKRHQDGDGVVLAGIGVDDDLTLRWHLASLGLVIMGLKSSSGANHIQIAGKNATWICPGDVAR